MNRSEIESAFRRLNAILKEKNIRGEIGIVGGAAMVLAFNARAATKDVDAIFQPSQEIRIAAKQVASETNLPEDWLNDAVKGFLPGQPTSKQQVIQLDHLYVWVPPAEYLLAMKAISARFDSMDAADIRTLVRALKLKKPQQVFDIVCKYYPNHKVPPKTVFFVEELFESI